MTALSQDDSPGAGHPVRILITGGGTGGHVYPGLAVAEAVGALASAAVIRFAGTRKGLESVLVPEAGYRLHTIPASGFRGLGVLARILFLVDFILGVLKSLGLLLAWRPAAVLGTGGYASAPVVCAASLLKVPCALQEQNAIPGSANRLLGRWVRRIYLGFASAASFFPAGRCVDTGNPVRSSFLAALGPGDQAPQQHSGFRILIFGGSSGARTLNRAVAEAARVWARRGDLSFRIQTGTSDREMVDKACGAAGTGFTVDAYIKDMAAALRWADLVVCRAGAMTLAEIQALGKPAVLVPFPHATDDHQLRNAEDCARAGAAVVLEDRRCDGPTLITTIDDVLRDPDQLAGMGRAARALARPGAARTIAADLLEMAGHRTGSKASRPAGTATGVGDDPKEQQGVR